MDQIAAAHVDTLGQYFETHVSTNEAARLGVDGIAGESNSQIDLRGLGPDQTLVLIDGRRMPGFPLNEFAVSQPDLNALPLHAIDRVEVLTGTAGGIYGYGALGGAVNVVLAHDRPGAELYVTSGLSSRGDAGRLSIEGRVEYSPDQGATDLTLDASLTQSQPLLVGQRDYLTRDRRESYRNDPFDYLALEFPHGNGIAAVDAFGDENLTLKPLYGGASLGSQYTVMPIGFEGDARDLGTALVKGAGKLDFGLSKGDAETYAAPNATFGSLLMNVRHQFGGGVEAYFDGIMLWNRGRMVYHNGGVSEGEVFLDPSSPADPFEQDIFAYFPMPTGSQDWRTNYNSSRFTVGVVAPMPFQWRATAEASWGAAQFQESLALRSVDGFAAYDADPFGSWSQFENALLGVPQNGYVAFTADNLYQEQSLRLAGPIFRTPGGPAMLTISLERHGEDAPSYTATTSGALAYIGSYLAAWSTMTTSVYAELRSPIFARDAPSPLLRDLELQAAVREDSQSDDFAVDPTVIGSPRAHATFTAASYLVGGKVSPLPWLMLRGSFAASATPPQAGYLIETTDDFGEILSDPKRGGDEAFFSEISGGSPHLRNVLATTVSAGFVLTPFGPGGLRLSLDYSHISKTHDVLNLSADTIVAHENLWPQRVQRGPLTDDDRALGYTAGPILLVDTTAMNGASQDIQTLDIHFDWPFAAPVGGLRVYGSASYTISDVQKGLFTPSLSLKGYETGPLAWRADAGVDWSLGSLTIGANLQYIDSYNIGIPGEEFLNETTYALQGSEDVPPQFFLDLHIGKRFHVANTDLRIDFGVNDVLDTAPARETALAGIGDSYSKYADPRRRRFELSISAAF